MNRDDGPRFIALEGGEGAGKSLLAARLAQRFERAGVHIVAVHEPGGTLAGRLVRALLTRELSLWGEVFAFLLARAELVSHIIRPHLDQGGTVLCDRFQASTIAYQGYGCRLDPDKLEDLNTYATGGLTPDLTIYLDLPPDTGQWRKYMAIQPTLPFSDILPETVRQRDHGDIEGPAMGRRDLAFHERVRAGYRAQLAAAPPGTWLEIDATQPPDAVEAAAWREIARRRGLPMDARDSGGH